MQKQTRELILMLIIGVLIGTSAVVVWNSHVKGGTALDEASTPVETGVTEKVLPGTSSVASPSVFLPLPPSIPDNVRVGLSVADQPAGKTVAVSNLSITGTKWIAVYDEQDGKPGWILGAARVHEGDTEATVELLRPEGTISGKTYYAAILNDDGDGEFSRLTDLPPLSPEKVIIVRFHIQ